MSDDVKELQARLVAMDFVFENSDAEFRRRYFLMRMAMQDALTALTNALGELPAVPVLAVDFPQARAALFIEAAMSRLETALRRSKAPMLEDMKQLLQGAKR